MAKVKIPKRIGGVKVPKKLRKQAKKVLKVTASPLAREFALAGLTLAAQRLLEGATKTQPAAGERPGKPPRPKLDGLDLAALLEAAAAEGAKRFLDSFQAPDQAAPRRRPGAASQA